MTYSYSAIGCKKGGRECVYPETPSISKTSSGVTRKNGQSSSLDSPGSSSEDYDDEEEIDRLETIVDENESKELSSGSHISSKSTLRTTRDRTSGQRGSIRTDSETPSSVQDKGVSPSPSTEGSVGYGTQTSSTSSRLRYHTTNSSSPEGLRHDWSHLPPDLIFYLDYFVENVTHHHYCFQHDSWNFIHGTFLDIACGNDALVHAIVGFSAFQYTLHNNDGKIQDFLQYYNKAVSLLLESLKKGERRSMGTLLTILQLATIEVSCEYRNVSD